MESTDTPIITGYDVWGADIHAEFCECQFCERAYESWPRHFTEDAVEEMLSRLTPGCFGI